MAAAHADELLIAFLEALDQYAQARELLVPALAEVCLAAHEAI